MATVTVPNAPATKTPAPKPVESKPTERGVLDGGKHEGLRILYNDEKSLLAACEGRDKLPNRAFKLTFDEAVPAGKSFFVMSYKEREAWGSLMEVEGVKGTCEELGVEPTVRGPRKATPKAATNILAQLTIEQIAGMFPGFTPEQIANIHKTMVANAEKKDTNGEAAK
jgi:uncharacterized protein (DUF433 family)